MADKVEKPKKAKAKKDEKGVLAPLPSTAPAPGARGCARDRHDEPGPERSGSGRDRPAERRRARHDGGSGGRGADPDRPHYRRPPRQAGSRQISPTVVFGP